MRKELRPALVFLLCLTLVTGVAYPLAVTAIAQVCFADRASGSVVVRDGRRVGSAWIGQPFTDPKYFWPRPSATAMVPYAGDAGAGSNLSPTNPAFVEAVKQRVAALQAADPSQSGPVPADLVTASASGLDPHISVAAARYQAGRVARARGLDETNVASLIGQMTEPRTFGVLGEPRVNVLSLNLALDSRPPSQR